MKQEQLNSLYGALTQRGAQWIGVWPFLFVMAVSLLSALFISYLYVHFYSNRGTGSHLHRAFPLLGMSITAIFVTIQFSLPLSLGLLGALSIVRFRAPVKEPEEIGFVMLVVAVSVVIATFKLAFLGVIFVAALVALASQAFARTATRPRAEGTIVISLPSDSQPGDATAITDLLRKRLRKPRLESVWQTDRESVMSYNFEGVNNGSLTALQAELSAAVRHSTHNVFLNRSR
jgi:hypothetical protein